MEVLEGPVQALRAQAEGLRRDVADAAMGSGGDVRLFGVGTEMIVGRLPELERRARTSVRNMQPRLRFQPSDTVGPSLDERSRRRGMVMQMMVDGCTARLHPLLASMEPGGCLVAPVFVHMLVIDDCTVLFEGPRAASGDGSAWLLVAADLVERAVGLWRSTWEQARPLSPPTSAERLLTPRELEVARALAMGLTDAQTARRLECSLRSVQRDAATVVRYLGAGSRGEAVALMLGRE